MKILFLDFDGVLNSADFLREIGRSDAISSEMVRRINRVIQATDCKIVISSTWRLIHPMGWLKALLRQHGMNDVVIDKTPDLLSEDHNRGDEIQDWLNRHPEVTSFAIVDDENDMSTVIDHLVQTTFKTGITDDHADRLIVMLNGQPK